MQLAKVIGDVIVTRKDEQLAGITLLLLQPLTPTRERGAASRATPESVVRAAASMRAMGTGCDQRVGGTGLET